MIGLIDVVTLRAAGADHEVEEFAIAADAMRVPLTLRVTDTLHDAVQKIVDSGFRELPVVDDAGQVIGFVDESDVARIYLKLTAAAAHE